MATQSLNQVQISYGLTGGGQRTVTGMNPSCSPYEEIAPSALLSLEIAASIDQRHFSGERIAGIAVLK